MIHSKTYHKLIEDKTPIVIVQGGSGASKTYSILQLLIQRAIKYQGVIISIVSETLPQLKVGAERDFYNILEKSNYYNVQYHNKSDRTYMFGKSKIEFFSADIQSKVLGARRDYLFINEAIRLNYDTAYTLIRYTNKQSFIDYNPSYEFWAHNILAQMSNVSFHNFTFKDNCTYDGKSLLPEMQLKLLLERAKKDKNFERVFVCGEIGKIEGLIFPNFTQVQKIPENIKIIAYGLDFGFTNDPTSLIKCGIDTANKKIYLEELCYRTGMLNSDIMKEFERHGLKKRDSEIFADSAEPKTIEEIYRQSWNIKGAAKGADSIINGISLIKEYDLLVNENSLNLIKELRNYKWKEDKNGQILNVPIDLWNHGIDAIRYCISSKCKQSNGGYSASSRIDYNRRFE